MKVFIVYFANNMICLWFQKAHEYSLRMVYEILYLVHLIQQPILKSKVWSIHPLCQAEQSTKTPMQKSKQTGRQTNMHEFWVHFCVMSPHRSPLPAYRLDRSGRKVARRGLLTTRPRTPAIEKCKCIFNQEAFWWLRTACWEVSPARESISDM